MKVALQMYSVRNTFKLDPVGVMRKVAGMGFKHWEICAFNPDSPYNYGLDLPLEEAKALLKELGVSIIGCHLRAGDGVIDQDLIDFLDYQAGIGCESPGVAAVFCADTEDIKRQADWFNELGRLCKDRGMRFHYHTHFHDHQLFDGKEMIDWILEYTDPGLVDLELDTFWAVRGGVDPVEKIHKYKDRLCMLHQKDFNGASEHRRNLWAGTIDPTVPVQGWESFQGLEEDFVEVGTGVLPIQDYIDAGNEIGLKYITLEQDYTKLDEMESIKKSMDAFHKFTGIEW